MNLDVHPQSVSTSGPETDQRRELDHLLRAGLVRERTQLHALLAYLGGKAIDHPGEALKEYTIGVEALGKPQDYDPRTDPTVRVEVAKLRKKIREYYSEAGATRPIRMEIPKGTYVPCFVTPLPAIGSSFRLRHWPVWLAASIAIASLLPWLIGREQPAALERELKAFWAPHLTGGVQTLLVYGEPLFLKVQGAYFRNPNVNRPEDFGADEKTARVLEALRPRETRPVRTFIGTGEAQALFGLTRLLASQGASVGIHGSSGVSWQDLKGKHVILLGGRKYNPQIPELPYQRAFESVNRKILNLHPRGNEPKEYVTQSITKYGELTEEYGIISVYPGFSSNTRLMTLESSSTEGTLLAAEFVTRGDTLHELQVRGLPPKPGSNRYPAFQVVVGGKLKDSVPVSLSYVTHRVLERR